MIWPLRIRGIWQSQGKTGIYCNLLAKTLWCSDPRALTFPHGHQSTVRIDASCPNPDRRVVPGWPSSENRESRPRCYFVAGGRFVRRVDLASAGIQPDGGVGIVCREVRIPSGIDACGLLRDHKHFPPDPRRSLADVHIHKKLGDCGWMPCAGCCLWPTSSIFTIKATAP